MVSFAQGFQRVHQFSTTTRVQSAYLWSRSPNITLAKVLPDRFIKTVLIRKTAFNDYEFLVRIHNWLGISSELEHQIGGINVGRGWRQSEDFILSGYELTLGLRICNLMKRGGEFDMDMVGNNMPDVSESKSYLTTPRGSADRNIGEASIPHLDYSRAYPFHLFAGEVSTIHSRLSQIVGINTAVMHFLELAFQNQKGTDTNSNRHKSENGNPERGVSSNSRRPIHGGLFLLLGCALVYLAFYIADEPNPPHITRLSYWGIGACGFVCIFHGIASILGFSVTQKYHLTAHNYCNTLIAIGRTAMANILSIDKQIVVIGALAEGSSIRSIERMTGVHRDTIMRLGVRVGKGCAGLLDSKMRNLPCRQLQFDELSGFIGKKERHCTPDDSLELGDVWTFCAIDSEMKIVPSFKCGKRDLPTANAFVADVASRMRNRVQISSDALRAYVDAIEMNFGADVDFAQIIKTYVTDDSHIPERRFSAPEIVITEKKTVSGFPDLRLASTSHIERLNGTTRLHMRRLTRLTYAFSKKLENFEAAVALHFAYYNFVKRHITLRATPAMAAGIERDFWTVGNLVEATV
jgi:IS1 family transposase